MSRARPGTITDTTISTIPVARYIGTPHEGATNLTHRCRWFPYQCADSGCPESSLLMAFKIDSTYSLRSGTPEYCRVRFQAVYEGKSDTRLIHSRTSLRALIPRSIRSSHAKQSFRSFVEGAKLSSMLYLRDPCICSKASSLQSLARFSAILSISLRVEPTMSMRSSACLLVVAAMDKRSQHLSRTPKSLAISAVSW